MNIIEYIKVIPPVYLCTIFYGIAIELMEVCFMKIVVVKSPRILSGLFRFIFKIKKTDDTE